MNELVLFPSLRPVSLQATAEHSEVGDAFPRLAQQESSDLLFTYGTLMRGQPRHFALGESVFEGEANLRGFLLYDTGYGFPAILEGKGVVQGEVYKIVNPSIWRMLDRLENGLYYRENVLVHIPSKAPNGRHVLVQTYVGSAKVFRAEQLRLIKDGRWENDGN